MNQDYITIKNWAEEDRPREKLILKGKAALSEAELIAILIGSGTKTLSAVDLSKLILSKYNNNLNELAKCSVEDLKKFKGIGEAKAITIVSALELGRRRKETEQLKKPRITSSKSVFEVMQGELLDLDHEQFWVLMLDRANQVIKKVQISAGGVAGTVVDQKILFKSALECLASGIILIHNHPSGNLKPSDQDIRLTKKIQNAGITLEIPVLDHLIFTNHAYFSFADESML
jgi:DNA repair protein RadC